jgi:hypothetical protein
MDGVNELFNELDELMEAMISSPPEDRVLIYRQIDPLFLRLEVELKKSPNGYAEKKLLELKYHTGVIARLDDPDGDDDNQHLAKAKRATADLRGPKGLGS